MAHDFVVFTGRIAFHYFPGFCRGRKSLTAYSLLTKAHRFNLILVSRLKPDTAEQMGIQLPAQRLDDALAHGERKIGHCQGYILPFGADALPIVD